MVIQFSSLSMSWLVSWGRGWVVGLGLRVDGGPLVLDVGHVSVVVVGGVGHCLHTAVG